MAVQTFGAVYIGSYEVSLKVFEFSAKKKIREIDHIRKRIDLGRDVYQRGVIGYESVEELCNTLSEFAQIMKGYCVESSEVFASAVLRDAENSLFVINQIFLRTCFRVKVLSNSEYRFVGYKSVVGRAQFARMIQTSAAVVDIGGSGIQITLFRKGELVTTQHMEMGSVRIRELLGDRGQTKERYQRQIEEYVSKKMEVFRSIYLQEEVDSIIILSDYCVELVKAMSGKYKEDDIIEASGLLAYIESLKDKSLEEICKELNLSSDQDPLILPSMIIYKNLISGVRAEQVWVPDFNINDGIAFDYAQRHGFAKSFHDFDADVISAAQNLSRRFSSYTPHIESLEGMSVKIFDTMKRVHGMGERERLLLRVAVLLHDCGKFISLANSPKCAYEIIMASEIIGLTHREREMIALTVFYNSYGLDEFVEMQQNLKEREFLVVAKLSAILRLANALDQSHKQKLGEIKITIKERTLVITVNATDDISLETALFEAKTAYFEKVFSMKPILKAKRS